MTTQPTRYLVKNKELFGNMSHGQTRHEFIVVDEHGAEVDRLEITPSTARWLCSGHGMELISAARWYALQGDAA